MCACMRCCLAIVITAVVLVVPQLEAAPIETPPPTSNQSPELHNSAPEKPSPSSTSGDSSAGHQDPGLGSERKKLSSNQDSGKTTDGLNIDHNAQHAESGFSIAEVTKPEAPSSPDASQQQTKQETKDPPGGSIDHAQHPAVAPLVQPPVAEGAKDDVPRINEGVAKMIKPAAVASSPATPPSPAKPPLEPAGKEHPATVGATKEAIPKINVAVAEAILPVAALPDTARAGPAPVIEVATTAATGDDHAKHVTDKESKVEGPVASSDSSEKPVQHPPALDGQSQPTDDNNKEVSERSVSDPIVDQPLTTVIIPVHSVQSKEGDVQPSTTDQTAVQGNPVKVLEEDNPSRLESSTLRNPNAYTITPNEFAKKTAVSNAQKSEGENEMSTGSVTGNIPGNLSGHLPTQGPKAGADVKVGTQGEGQEQKSDKTEDKVPNDKNHQDINNDKSNKATPETTAEANLLKFSSVQENSNLISISVIAHKLTNDLKMYKDELSSEWKERREKISWLGDVTYQLQSYYNQIKDTGKYSDKCITGHLAKYEERKDTLKSIMDKCEKPLNRKYWHELEDKTNEELSKIREIVRTANAEISNIPKEDQHFNERKLEIEDKAKRKLKDFNIELLKKTFSDLKTKALKTDEEDYKKCIDNTDTQEKGQEIRSQAMSDYMKIYTCVDNNNNM